MPGHGVIVFSSLFPNAANPVAGVFVKERTFRLAARMPLAVVAPQPWSPVDGLIRAFRRSFRPPGRRFERVDGVEVHRPRFLCLPGLGKRLDGWLMAQFSRGTVRRLQQRLGATVIDAHFAYPDGYAATLLAQELGMASTITLGGSKDQGLIGDVREGRLRAALARATQVIAVSASLRDEVAVPMGCPAERVRVIGNGVNLAHFHRVDRGLARARLGIPADAQVLVSVGNLVHGKGFHRVIPLLPQLLRQHPRLLYLVVGGGSTHGDIGAELLALAARHGVTDRVRLCGRQPPDALRHFYSAADVFTLATAYEGWANVFLEAMACGTPVVSTLVGGNRQVVAGPQVGTLVRFWDAPAFLAALHEALARDWDREAIVAYARRNRWESRMDELEQLFRGLPLPSAAAALAVGAAH